MSCLTFRRTLPGIEEKSRGCEGVYVLRGDDGTHVEFLTLTLWQSMDAIKTLVGDDVERAHVPAEARKVLDRFEERAIHYELVLKTP